MDLSTKAMLVRLSISSWTASKHDKKISNEIACTHNAKQDSGRYNKSLVSKQALEEIKSIDAEIRIFHYNNTLPWSDEGLRILPSDNFIKYSGMMRELKSKREIAIKLFLEKYASYVEESKERLGTLFNERDYPNQLEIELKFGIKNNIYPFPSANDFRVGLNDEDVKHVKKEITNTIKEAQHIAMQDLWKRLYDSVHKISERLSDPEKIFRNSLIGNLVELCSLLPNLNVANDKHLEQMRKEVEQKICSFHPDDLRKDKNARKQTAKTADDILSAMSGYIGGVS